MCAVGEPERTAGCEVDASSGSITRGFRARAAYSVGSSAEVEAVHPCQTLSLR